jgi:type IV pilus assembly protein PilV
MKTTLRSVSGMAMLEVLITMLLITLALLGTAGMQAYGMKVTHGAQFRAQAVVIAGDLLERIEANNTAAVNGTYAPGTLPDPSTAADCTANRCSSDDMAQYDLVTFVQNIQAQLPAGTATVTRTGAGPWTYTVTITWQERSYRQKSTAMANQATVETFTYTVNRTIYNRSSLV